MVEARFDDLRGEPAEAFRFTGSAGIIEARTADEVPSALDAVQGAIDDGLWAAGFLAYEAAPGLDPHLAVRDTPPNDVFADVPLVWFGLFEHWEQAPPVAPGDYRIGGWRPSVTREAYEAAVERIQAYIRAGDTYQVNHTFRLRSSFEGDDRAFYGDLLAAQRASHCAYLDTGRYRILSASPEMFLSLDGTRLLTRPMKGTAARGRWSAEDREHERALVASAKERAENAMIVDLLRNDMGRISVPGSVHVTRMFETERYETLWQLTSTIESEIDVTTSFARLANALFPSGSVTGAPKVRAMEITAELEDSPRGVYTGAIGWLAPAGERPRMSFNVAIRTVEIDTDSGTARFGVGGGITHDSIAGREYEECLTKALVLTERRPDLEIIETLLLEDREVVWLDRHLDRMAASAAYFDFHFDRGAAHEALDAIREVGPGKVRLTLARSGDVSVSVGPLGPTGPVKVTIDDVPVDPNDPFLFHKTTRRRPYEEAAARHPEADDVLLINDRSEVTEATTSNLLVRFGDLWTTPVLTSGLLPGIHRAVLLERGEVEERVITIDDVRDADELALINSVRMRRGAELSAGRAPPEIVATSASACSRHFREK
jgi:para-aminobenzoate synthetase/4-amino-4-deoxychorismate lyase